MKTTLALAWVRLLIRANRLWLGAHRILFNLPAALLTPEELIAVTTTCYNRAGRSDAWRETTEQGLTPSEDRFLRRWGGTPGRILVISSGGGRETVALARRGWKVTGIDVSRPLLEHCRRENDRLGLDIEYVEMDVYRLVLPERSYDVVWFSGASIGYVPGKRRRLALLRTLGARMVPGGRFFLSFGTTVKNVDRLPREAATERFLGRIARLVGNPEYESGDRTCNEGEFYHYYHTLDAALAELREAGLSALEASNDHELYPWASLVRLEEEGEVRTRLRPED